VLAASGSASSSAWRWSTLVGDDVGQSDLVGNQSGPCVHRCDDFSLLVDSPLVRRSAGLSVDGVKDQRAVGKVS